MKKVLKKHKNKNLTWSWKKSINTLIFLLDVLKLLIMKENCLKTALSKEGQQAIWNIGMYKNHCFYVINVGKRECYENVIIVNNDLQDLIIWKDTWMKTDVQWI